MSMPEIILLVEGARPSSSLVALLDGRRFTVLRASNSKEALQTVHTQRPALAIVHASTLHTDGQRICLELRATSAQLPIILVIRRHATVAEECDAEVLVEPFTKRKLFSCISRLLPQPQGQVLAVDDIALNLDTHFVRVGRNEHRLTPMKARLLEEFLRHPGEVLSREYLMKTVWRTNYVGDTRTIEVHMRWLRQIIETDPARPDRLQTIRGVGYRSTIGLKD